METNIIQNRVMLNDYEISVDSGNLFTTLITSGNFVYYKKGTGTITIEDTKNQSKFSLIPGQSCEIAEYHKLNIYSDYSDTKILCCGYGKIDQVKKPDYLDVLEDENLFLSNSYGYSSSDYFRCVFQNPSNSGKMAIFKNLELECSDGSMFHFYKNSGVYTGAEENSLNLNLNSNEINKCKLLFDYASSVPSARDIRYFGANRYRSNIFFNKGFVILPEEDLTFMAYQLSKKYIIRIIWQELSI